MLKISVRDWEFVTGGRIVINGGEHTVRVHPNMPVWLVTAHMARAVGRAPGPHKVFALAITDRCNIRCDFCCHPYLNSALTDEDCLRMVKEACSLPFDEICVTGGEPFLRRKVIYDLALTCKANGRLFGSITNGFWGKEREKAFQLAQEMVSCGVGRVTFSWDPSHGEFISPQTIQNGVDACMQAGMRVCLTGSFKRQDDCHENYGIDVSAYKQFANFSVVTSYVAPAGRGKLLSDYYKVPVSQEEAAEFRCPGHAVQELVMYARDGLAQPCCSVYAGYDMPNLRIGDWRTQSVAELLDAQQGNGFFRVVADGGFRLLYEIIEDRAPDVRRRLPALRAALSPCHVCQMLMNGEDASRIREVCDDYVTDRLAAEFTANAAAIGELLTA